MTPVRENEENKLVISDSDTSLIAGILEKTELCAVEVIVDRDCEVPFYEWSASGLGNTYLQVVIRGDCMVIHRHLFTANDTQGFKEVLKKLQTVCHAQDGYLLIHDVTTEMQCQACEAIGMIPVADAISNCYVEVRG